GDRKNLLPKGPSKAADRLQELITAAETVRGYIRYFANQQAAVVGVRNEVQDLRKNKAPDVLRSMRDRHQRTGLEDDDWKRFLLTYSGNVEEAVNQQAAEAQRGMFSWRGSTPSALVDGNDSYIRDTDDPTKLPLALLEAEIARLEKLVAADKET